MNQKTQVKQESIELEDEIQDCVVFMTAYHLNKFSIKMPRFGKNKRIVELLTEYHISSFATEDTFLNKNRILKYTVQFNSQKQSTEFHFDLTQKDENIEDEVKEMSWILMLTQSMQVLLDKAMFGFKYGKVFGFYKISYTTS